MNHSGNNNLNNSNGTVIDESDIQRIAKLCGLTSKANEQSAKEAIVSTFGKEVNLYDIKKKDPSYFKKYEDDELYSLLLDQDINNRTIIPQSIEPEYERFNWHAVFVTGGQLINVVENALTVQSLIQKRDVYKTKFVVSHMMPKIPSDEQIQTIRPLIEKLVPFSSYNGTEKWAPALWTKGYFSTLTNVEFVPFQPMEDSMKSILQYVSSRLPDKRQRILIIGTDVLRYKNTFVKLCNESGNGSFLETHDFKYCQIPQPDIEMYRNEFIGNSIGFQCALYLKSLAFKLNDKRNLSQSDKSI